MSQGHAKLAPSAAKRWMACPGSVAMCACLPNVESDFADEGTAAHTIAAELLVSGLPAHTQVGRVQVVTRSNGDIRTFDVTQEMAAHIQIYVNAVKELTLLASADLLVEQQVVVVPNYVWGTSDAIAVSRDRLDVIDLKFGRGVLVHAEGNAQLAIYALGAMRALRERDPSAKIKTIGLHIVQPRRPDNEGLVHRTWTMTIDELEAFGDSVRYAIEATQQIDAPLVTGEHCQFCPARGTCPQLRAVALASAQAVFPDLDATNPLVPPPAPESLSLADLSRVLRAADIVETWIGAVRKHALDRATQGEHITGMKLVQKIGNRRWVSPAAAAELLLAHGLTPYLPAELMSPAQVEAALGKKAAARFVSAMVERPLNGVALVPEKDKRPRIEGPVLGIDFADLDNERL